LTDLPRGLIPLRSSFETGPEWLRALRERAADTLRADGLPTKKTEAWRFTPVRTIVQAKLSRVAEEAPTLRTELPEGVTARSLRAVLQDEPELLQGRIDLGGAPEHFAALNTALFTDGLWIDVEAGIFVETPIEVAHDLAGAGVSYPRVLLTAGESAELTLIETYAGSSADALTNSVLEVDLASNAKVTHVRVHENAGLQVGRVDVRQADDSRYRSTVVTLGGALHRFDVRALLQGKGAQCQLDGAYLVDGEDHVDHHTLVEHQAPHCRSDQTYRGIVAGKGTAVFDGIVVVHRDAQKTEAHQENRNLRPYGFVRAPEGRIGEDQILYQTLTSDYVGSANYNLTAALKGTFSVGGQYIRAKRVRTSAFGQGFAGPGVPTVSDASLYYAAEDRLKTVNAGFFVQNMFDVNNVLFITAGLRVDGNSAFGKALGLQAYPKVSVSYVLSDNAFWPSSLGEVKLRAAAGYSGRAPSQFAAIRTWNSEPSGGLPGYEPANVGNDEVGPAGQSHGNHNPLPLPSA